MAELELGVLAEDENDCDVIRVLCRRILESRGVERGAWRAHKRFGKGAAKLRQKAARWLSELRESGCRAAIIVHDLDRDPANGTLNDVAALHKALSAIAVPNGLARHICIPVEEIEAWFFSSEKILTRLAGKPQSAHPSPHQINGPKEKLIHLSRGANLRPRHSENDNPKLAEDLDLVECAKRCPAFDRLAKFIGQLVQ